MGFPHLKRMKKHDHTPGTLLALVAPVGASADAALMEQLQHEYDGSLCVVEVLKRAPETRERWEIHTKRWPLIFHASVVPETQTEPISDREVRAMELLVRQAIASGVRYRAEALEGAESRCCAMGCVIADPTGSKDGMAYAVVTDSLTRLQDTRDDGNYAFRTLFHPVMVAIDGVAARDRARDGDGGPSKKKKPRRTDDSTTSTTMAPTESYLCTGYDVFMDVEPCAMCAMALVHSRARRVVFATANPSDGAVASVHRLHTIKSLNHRYRVFHFKLPVTIEVNETTDPAPEK
jgi:tRNA-specific adenosine deaminase 3